MNRPLARLIFENGTIFSGKVFANGQDNLGEVIFNTAMSGYQEILTDPSYYQQIVMMTYPLIGNYGINDDDIESRKLFLSGFIVREYLDFASNWRSQKTLKTYLEESGILGVDEMDTRAITRYIRTQGAQKALLTTSDESESVLIEKVKAYPGLSGRDLVKDVSCDSAYDWHTPTSPAKYRVAVIDCGTKYNILRILSSLGCQCHVFPSSVTADELFKAKVDGIFISNGPGDPAEVTSVVRTVQQLLGKLPLFGICLGHQILGLALGGTTYKLQFGHHGANHPVKNLITGHVEITSQNHGFCVDYQSLNSDDIAISHINLNDQTIEGIRHKKYPAFSVQYHPEASPGPHDSQYLFHDFIHLMKKGTL